MWDLRVWCGHCAKCKSYLDTLPFISFDTVNEGFFLCQWSFGNERTVWKICCDADHCILTQSLFWSVSLNNARVMDLHLCVRTLYKKLGKLHLSGSTDGSNIPQSLQYESSFHIKKSVHVFACTHKFQRAQMKTNIITVLNKIKSEQSLLSAWLTVTLVVCKLPIGRHQGRSWLCKSQRCHLIFPIYWFGKKAQIYCNVCTTHWGFCSTHKAPITKPRRLLKAKKKKEHK